MPHPTSLLNSWSNGTDANQQPSGSASSQWLFPKFFAGGEDELWLGEGGLLPVAGYVVLGVVIFTWMRWRGPSWKALARHALTTSTIEP
jgi:hypothetical protein